MTTTPQSIPLKWHQITEKLLRTFSSFRVSLVLMVQVQVFLHLEQILWLRACTVHSTQYIPVGNDALVIFGYKQFFSQNIFCWVYQPDFLRCSEIHTNIQRWFSLWTFSYTEYTSCVTWTLQDEKQRIEDLGGCIAYMGCWRVNGTYAVSRAIGKSLRTNQNKVTRLALYEDIVEILLF